MRHPPAVLLAHRSNPAARDVLHDWCAERGQRQARLGVALWISAADDAAADDAAADAADDAAADADAADAAAAADDAADAAADDDDVIRKRLHKLLTGEIDMRNGLKIIQVPGRYGYSVTLVGWLENKSGDEFLLHNACTVARTESYRLDGLQKLASDGPGKRGYNVTEPAKMPEEIHRLLVRRSLIADEKAWAAHCPKPKGWAE